MSLAEVQSILGPPGDHRTEPSLELQFIEVEREEDWFHRKWGSDEGQQHTRKGDRGRLWMLVGKEGVRGKHFTATEMGLQSRLDDLPWRAKRQWRRWFPE